VAVLLLAAVGAGAGGCSMTQEEEAALAVESVQATQAEVQRVVEQTDATLAALNDLAGNPKSNLRPQYDTLATAVEGLKIQADLTRERAKEMRAKGTAYFGNWGQNPDSRIRPELKASFDRIAEESGKAGDAFNPFLDSLADIQKLLSMDLTGTGVNLIQDLVKKANSEAQVVKQRLQAASDELERFSSLLAPPKNPSS
jgi:hypothetical protein